MGRQGLRCHLDLSEVRRSWELTRKASPPSLFLELRYLFELSVFSANMGRSGLGMFFPDTQGRPSREGDVDWRRGDGIRHGILSYIVPPL